MLFAIATTSISLALLGGNLISTFALADPVAENTVNSTLFNFDKAGEATSTEGTTSTEEATSTGGTTSTATVEENPVEENSVGFQLGSTKKTSISVELSEYNDIPYCLIETDLAYLSDLRTAMAEDSSGKIGVNIKSSFSELIENAEGDPILAIDGDFPFWSTSRKGYVIRNGVGFRSSTRTDDGDDLAIFKNGSFLIYSESDYSYDDIMDANEGCWQNWSFGPSLIKDGAINVAEDEEVSGKSMSANQRVAMGIKEDGTFYFLCSELDGNRQKGDGLSLYELAGILLDQGCVAAYNFDGGGSAALYYNLNGEDHYFIDPSRELGDIVYVVAS